MESQSGLGQQQVEGGRSARRRERTRGGGSGGLIVGIATVVVVGVAGKFLLRLNSLNRANNAVAAGAAAKDSIDKVVASGGQQSRATVLKKVLSVVGNQETDHRGSNAPSIETFDVDEKYIGCETPIAVEGKDRSRLFCADAEISDQDSLSDSDSKCAEIQVKHPLNKVVPAYRDGEADLAAQTCLAELVHQSVKHEVPSHDQALIVSKAKNLAEVISPAFVDFGRGELSSLEQADPKKLTVQVVWGDKSDSDQADAADIPESVSESENPAHCDAEDNSEGFTYHSESESESESESGYVVGEFMEARDTDSAAAGDELDVEFVNAETQIEDTRFNSEVSGSECTDWPQAITFSEFINSIQAFTSAEITDQLTEDVSALEDTVADRNSFVLPQQSDVDLPQADRDYLACEDPSAVHDEAEYSVGESDTFYDQSHEEAESVLRECEACPSSKCQEEGDHIYRENQIEDASRERQEHETESKFPEILKEMEPAVEEKFDGTLSSLELEATKTPAANVDKNDEVDKAAMHTEEEEQEKASTAEDTLVVQATDAKEIGAIVVTLQNAEVALGHKEEEDANVKATFSVVLPSKPYNPNNSFKHSRRYNVADSSSTNTVESGIMASMEFTSPSHKGGNFKQLGTSRDRSATEVLKMAILIALIAAIIFMIREHHLKLQSVKHAA